MRLLLILLLFRFTSSQLLGGSCNDSSGTCAPHGKCMNGSEDGTFWCRCDNGYGGDLCERECDLECDDDEKCVFDEQGGNPMCFCKDCYNQDSEECPDGFEGPLCSTPSLNPCLENPCNSGKCYRIPGGYQCICDNGFRGSSCEIGTDHCLNNKCADGSVCVNTDIDYYCACPPGKSGKRCEIANCGCAHGRCVDSPTGGVCECHEGFEGDYCDIDKDECRIPGICMNNGTCVNIPGGFQCLCRPGYTGDLCQDPLDTCKDHPCQNQGECATLPDQTPICICPQGFMGDRCETPCPPGYGGYQCTLTQPHCSRKRGPCWNGGVCIHGFCKCPPEFTGDRCERKRCPVGYSEPECEKKTERCEECLNGGKCLETSGLCDCPYGYKGTRCQDIVEEEGLCLQHNCSSLASNSICNPECNSKECGFDGGDCSDSPFAKCLYPSRCAEIFGNGVCDQECNNEGCLFDGLDCQEHPKCPERSHCVLRRGDGVCDPECSLIGCGFDGGDCSQGDTQILRDIRVRIHLDALEEALMDISARLRATVRIQKDSKGPLVFDDTEKRVEGLIQGQVVLYLEVECEGKCRFSSAQSVVDLIAAGLVKSDGRSSLGLPITDAMVAAPRGTESHTLYIILGFLGIGVLIAVVILKGSRSRKRKIITAPVWIPPLPSMEAGSSQCSLLDGYYGETKRWETYPGQMGLTAKEIPLHLQAASSEPITCLLTPQSVNQLDATYHRNVLHWLAGNTNGKPEDLIVDETRRCLEIGAAVNTRDSDDNTPLMLAVKTRRLRLAVVLLRSHADPTIFNKSERSALHEAVANKDLRMAEILLTDERLQKEIDELDRNGMTALMSVASGSQLIALAKLLIDRGAKLDADGGTRKDSDRYKGRTALHYAALSGNLPMVEYLVTRGANKDKQDEAGRTPLMLAAKEGNEEVCRFLVARGASLTVVDAMDKGALQYAGYHQEIVEFLEEVSRKEPLPSSKPKKKAPVHLTPPPSDGSFSSDPSPTFPASPEYWVSDLGASI